MRSHLWFTKTLGWFILFLFGPGFLLKLSFSPCAGELLCHESSHSMRVTSVPQMMSSPLVGRGQDRPSSAHAPFSTDRAEVFFL